MTIGIRGFTEHDFPILVKLLNEAYKDDFEFIPYTEEKLRTWLAEGKLKILMAEENGKIMGTAAYNDGFWGEEIEWLAIQNVPNSRALEDLLVNEAEKYVKKGKAIVGAPAASPKIAEWTERGYKPENGMHRMTAKLERKLPLPPVPEGIIVRSLKPHEEEEFVETVKTGFGWERVRMGNISFWKTENPPFDEDWIHVAEADGRIVSVVVARPDTNYNDFFNANRAHLGPATTLPEHRRRNLATILTVGAMNSLFEKGYDSAVLGAAEQNTASITLLKKLGFEIKHHWKIMHKSLPPQLQSG
jgi:ribosomal protein S18 acetylase RimI-like enzyme